MRSIDALQFLAGYKKIIELHLKCTSEIPGLAAHKLIKTPNYITIHYALLTGTGAQRLRGIAGRLEIGLGLLSTGQQEVGRRELNACRLGNGSLAQRHSANSGHVGLRSKNVQWDAQGAAKVAHLSKTLLIVGSSAAHKDRYIVLD